MTVTDRNVRVKSDSGIRTAHTDGYKGRNCRKIAFFDGGSVDHLRTL